MTELFQHFPAAWGLLGMIFASVIFLIASRQVFKMQGIANENLVKTLDHQINALKDEKDVYKDQLHGEKNSHQATLLRLKELESRPDMTSLASLLSSHISSVQKISSTLEGHVQSDAKMFEKLTESLSKIPTTLDKMSASFDRRQAEALKEIKNRRQHA